MLKLIKDIYKRQWWYFLICLLLAFPIGLLSLYPFGFVVASVTHSDLLGYISALVVFIFLESLLLLKISRSVSKEYSTLKGISSRKPFWSCHLVINLLYFLVCFFIFAIIVICVSGINYFNTIKYDKNLFLDNESKYTEIAQLYYENYEILNTDDKITFFIPNDNSVSYQLNGSNDKFDMTEEQYEVYKDIEWTYNKILKDQGLNHICVYDNFVVFGNMNRQQSLVYSVDGISPTNVDGESVGNVDFYSEKILENWYYTCYK